MQATIVRDGFLLSEVQRAGSETILVAPCVDYQAWEALPRVLRFEGQTFGLTGWNSDREQAYWRPTKLAATSIPT